MPEFITIQRAGGQKQVLNLSLITRCVVHFDGGSATVNFDIDSIEIHGRSEVAQLMDGITRASASSVAPEVAGSAVSDRLVNLIGELELEKSYVDSECFPGLDHAIAHVQKIVDQYAEVR